MHTLMEPEGPKTTARHMLRNSLLSLAYAHPAALAVLVRRGPSAASTYLTEMYRCSKTDAGLHLPIIAMRTLAPQEASFSVFRPPDADGSMTLTEIASLCDLVASRRPAKILEVGSFQGLTTLNLAKNAPEGEVHTVDLPAGADPGATTYANNDAAIIARRGVCHFAGRPEEARIRQHLGDTATFDFAAVGEGIDLCLIDAAHSYEYVRNDTARVLPWLADRCLLLWHDYGRNDFLVEPEDAWGVTRFLNELAGCGVGIIEGTSLGALELTPDARRSLSEHLGAVRT